MEFIEEKTKNGIRVYLMPIAGLKSVACGAMINVGSRDESSSQFGIAHALEHMPFKGTKKFDSNFSLSSYIEEVGGFINASTNRDRTLFYSKVPDYEIARSINWLHEVLEQPLLRGEDWDSEKKVIIEEIKKSNDNPASYFSDLVFKNIFHNHPMGHPVLGTEESVSGLSVSDIINFRKKFYNSKNYVFFAAGNIDIKKTINLFDDYFGKLDGGMKNEKRETILLKPDKNLFINEKDVKQNRFNLSFLIDKLSFDDMLALDFFTTMLSGGEASPLFQEFRVKRSLAYSIGSFYYPGIDIGYFSISTSTISKSYEEMKGMVMSVINATKENKVRFEQTKNMILGALSFSFESPFNIVASAARETVYFGKPIGYDEYYKKIKSMKIEQIGNLILKYFTEDNAYLNVLLSIEKK